MLSIALNWREREREIHGLEVLFNSTDNFTINTRGQVLGGETLPTKSRFYLQNSKCEYVQTRKINTIFTCMQLLGLSYSCLKLVSKAKKKPVYYQPSGQGVPEEISRAMHNECKVMKVKWKKVHVFTRRCE